MFRDARKERQWCEWIGARQDSGLTVRDFCHRRRLTEWNFYAWRRELQRRANEPEEPRRSSQEAEEARTSR